MDKYRSQGDKYTKMVEKLRQKQRSNNGTECSDSGARQRDMESETTDDSDRSGNRSDIDEE